MHLSGCEARCKSDVRFAEIRKSDEYANLLQHIYVYLVVNPFAWYTVRPIEVIVKEYD